MLGNVAGDTSKARFQVRRAKFKSGFFVGFTYKETTPKQLYVLLGIGTLANRITRIRLPLDHETHKRVGDLIFSHVI